MALKITFCVDLYIHFFFFSETHSCEAARWLMATACMYRRRNCLTHSGPPQCRRYVRAEGLLRTDERQRGAGAWDEPTHEQPQRGEQSPKTRNDPGGTGGRDAAGGLHGGPYPHAACIGSETLAMSAPSCAFCERLRTLCERGCVLAPPHLLACAGGAGLN